MVDHGEGASHRGGRVTGAESRQNINGDDTIVMPSAANPIKICIGLEFKCYICM